MLLSIFVVGEIVVEGIYRMLKIKILYKIFLILAGEYSIPIL